MTIDSTVIEFERCILSRVHGTKATLDNIFTENQRKTA